MEIKNLTVKYGDQTVYDKFNLLIEEGKITAVLGDSGSGKTTLIKAILGLIDFDGEINGENKKSAVFQNDCLIDNITVEKNIKLVNKDADVCKLLKDVGLSGLEKKYPSKLSGGQKRRVSIARALAYDSDTLILDEPFNSLDYKLKVALLNKLKEINRNDNKTVVFITHDPFEAVNVADRIIVVEKGKIKFDSGKDGFPTQNGLTDILSN